MTGQIHDMVLHNGSIFSLCGIRGDGLFDPADYGLEPSEMSTACRRGYHCLYAIKEDILYLEHVKIGHNADRPVRFDRHSQVKLFGVGPAEGDHLGSTFTALNQRMFFSGSLLLGRDFIAELYRHIGFQLPHNCRTVVELTFEAGTVVQAADRSEEMREIRQQQAREEREERRRLLHASEKKTSLRPVAGVFSLEY